MEASIKYLNHLTWYMVQCAAESLLLGVTIRQLGSNFDKVISLLNEAQNEGDEDIESDEPSSASSFPNHDTNFNRMKKWEHFDPELQLYFVAIWQLLGGSQNETSPIPSIPLHQTGIFPLSAPNRETRSARRNSGSNELNYGHNLFWMKESFHEWFHLYYKACKNLMIPHEQILVDLATHLNRVLKACLMGEELQIFPFVSSHGNFWNFVVSLIQAGITKNLPSFLQTHLDNHLVENSPSLTNSYSREYSSYSEDSYVSDDSSESDYV